MCWQGAVSQWDRDTLTSASPPSHCLELAHPDSCFPSVAKVFCLFYTMFFWWGRVTFKSQETVYIKNKTKRETQNCDLFWKNSKDLVMLAVCSIVTAAGVCNCEHHVICTLRWSLLLLTFPEPWKPDDISVSFVLCATSLPCRGLYLCRWFESRLGLLIY